MTYARKETSELFLCMQLLSMIYDEKGNPRMEAVFDDVSKRSSKASQGTKGRAQDTRCAGSLSQPPTRNTSQLSYIRNASGSRRF